ncbi:uncharacterized protein LOC122658941 [Telopea speciosissima]|uniref:uncharacterized protein LOC122658941 n=1 Tax=Telopea speciosissima TaxID=54955 RepID=UPI001CC34E89|nr:uncharacterized protein LOC122658941 [Telopea speciosissima]
MELAVQTLSFSSLISPKTTCQKKIMDIGISRCFPRQASCSLGMTNIVPKYFSRTSCRFFASASAVSAENVSAAPFEDFSVTTTTTSKATELKIKVDVYGAKTQAIFDDVFSEMVSAAQPIPGFQRVKGGKTPNKGLKVTSDLRVNQSFEELESTFEPGEAFSFDAVIQLQGK